MVQIAPKIINLSSKIGKWENARDVGGVGKNENFLKVEKTIYIHTPTCDLEIASK